MKYKLLAITLTLAINAKAMTIAFSKKMPIELSIIGDTIAEVHDTKFHKQVNKSLVSINKSLKSLSDNEIKLLIKGTFYKSIIEWELPTRSFEWPTKEDMNAFLKQAQRRPYSSFSRWLIEALHTDFNKYPYSKGKPSTNQLIISKWSQQFSKTDGKAFNFETYKLIINILQNLDSSLKLYVKINKLVPIEPQDIILIDMTDVPKVANGKDEPFDIEQIDFDVKQELACQDILCFTELIKKCRQATLDFQVAHPNFSEVIAKVRASIIGKDEDLCKYQFEFHDIALNLDFTQQEDNNQKKSFDRYNKLAGERFSQWENYKNKIQTCRQLPKKASETINTWFEGKVNIIDPKTFCHKELQPLKITREWSPQQAQ